MVNTNIDNTTITFEFPIKTILGEALMKNILHSTLLNFYSITTKDLETLLFEFNVLCRSYDYTSNGQKIKFFPPLEKELHYIGLWVLEVRLFPLGMI